MAIIDIHNSQYSQKKKKRHLLNDGLVVQPALPVIAGFFF
jgi:hypothetical protein